MSFYLGESSVDVSKNNIRIKILNATKINGLASRAMKKLNSAGYGNIDTGNIEASDKV